MAGTPYNKPSGGGSCGRNFIIYISNGSPADNNADSRTASDGLAALGGDTREIPLSPAINPRNMSDEWARFMYHKSPEKIVTFTLDVDKKSTGQGPAWTEMLRSMARQGEGGYFDVSSAGAGEQIQAAMGNIFSQIQGVNSVFASVSLPVSVNTEGTYLNQIYIGMFRPDSAGLPRWMGNLKQYKLGISGGRLETQDADSARAVNNSTGFITECARSFWTPTTTDAYWAFLPDGYWRTRLIATCLAVAGSEDSNFPDGNIVEKGAQAYTLRVPTTGRTLHTTPACSLTEDCAPLEAFNSSNVTDTELGAANPAEHGQLVDWALGLDVDDEQASTPPVTAERRPSIHGDVVHSRPVAVNMNTDLATTNTLPEVVVFYGGNDGVLRAINGNRTGSIGSVAAGVEMWAFMPPEFYPNIKRLRDNTIKVDSFGNNFTDPDPEPKPYGVDGPIVAHRDLVDPADPDDDVLWIFASLRRSGQMIYAFDMSSIHDDATSPELMWRNGCDSTGCTPNFSEMGQTWSAPQVMRAAGWNDGGDPMATPTPIPPKPKPMLIVGGGYDICEDGDPHTCTAPKGNRVYVLDAESGDWLTEFTTDRGVVSDVFVIKDADTGLAKWAYAADLGGNIYRISGATANAEFGTTPPASWTMTKIASLGCTTATATCARKFMMPMDVVAAEGGYVILIGSGDREKPILGFDHAATVSNYFFKINDHPADPAWLTGECGPTNNLICLSSLLPIPNAPDPDQPNPTPAELLSHPKGWALAMLPTEQVVTSAITVFGTTTFSTHTPVPLDAGACTSSLGEAKVYNIGFSNAANPSDPLSRSDVIVGGGLPPSPVAGMVTLDNGQTVPFLIGGETNSPLEGGEPIPSGLADQPKAQTYWYIHK
jgi:type IV pilus assembly protein PilY1